MVQKYQCLAIIVAILSLEAVICNDQCDYSTSETCLADRKCRWNSEAVCGNETNCSYLERDDCQSNFGCVGDQSTNGTCSRFNLGCSIYGDQESCLDQGRYCSWDSSSVCQEENPDLLPVCASLDSEQCQENSLFCEQQSSTCQEKKDTCEQNVNQESCESSDACTFEFTNSSICTHNEEGFMCTYLSKQECNSDPLCNYIETAPATCEEAVDCQALNEDDCLNLHSNVCTAVKTEFSCKNNHFNQCDQFVDGQNCATTLNCLWNNGRCSQFVDCELFQTQDECLSARYQDTFLCTLEPKQFACQNKGICKDTPDCQYAEQLGECKSSPPQGECVDLKNECEQLTEEQCRSDIHCKVIQQQQQFGTCHAKNFDCARKSTQECEKDPHCEAVKSCTQKNLKNCSEVSIADCWQQPQCVLFKAGKCEDRSFPCNKISHRNRCLLNRVCSWKYGEMFTCSNRYDCESYDSFECENKSPQCKKSFNNQPGICVLI